MYGSLLTICYLGCEWRERERWRCWRDACVEGRGCAERDTEMERGVVMRMCMLYILMLHQERASVRLCSKIIGFLLSRPHGIRLARWQDHCASYLQQHEGSLASQCGFVKLEDDPNIILPEACTSDSELVTLPGYTASGSFMVLNLLRSGTESANEQGLILLRKHPSLLEDIDHYRLTAAIGPPRGTFTGWAPDTTEPDDKLCLFEGASRPFVLRKAKQSGVFTIIGDAWIPGFPQAEDILNEKDEK